MRSILVATDLSPIAQNAMEYAIEIAKKIKGKIILFHLFQVSSHTANSLVGTKSIDEMLDRRRVSFANLAYKLSQEYEIEVEAVVKMGDFLEVVAEVSNSLNCSLLVLGMPPKSFEQDLLGNTTTAAIYKLKMPILAIPESAKFKGINTIFYACDLKRGIHGKVIDTVKQYAENFNATVHVFYIGKALKKLENQMELVAGFEGVNFTYKHIESETIIERIQQEADDLQADLMVMTPNKYSFWASILHRSKTRAMASNGKIPLLSIAY